VRLKHLARLPSPTSLSRWGSDAGSGTEEFTDIGSDVGGVEELVSCLGCLGVGTGKGFDGILGSWFALLPFYFCSVRRRSKLAVFLVQAKGKYCVSEQIGLLCSAGLAL
jgi:hypothetical protein